MTNFKDNSLICYQGRILCIPFSIHTFEMCSLPAVRVNGLCWCFCHAESLKTIKCDDVNWNQTVIVRSNTNWGYLPPVSPSFQDRNGECCLLKGCMLLCCNLHRIGWQGFVSQQEYNNLYRMDIKITLLKVTKMIWAGKIVIEFMLNTLD